MNEIVAYWNGSQLRDLFEAIVFIVGGADFLGLLRTVAVFGLLIMTTMAVLRSRAIEPMAYIAALALFYTLMLVPKMNLTIKDVRSGNVYVVSNVPYGVGVFASAASHIGVWLTDTFEAAFAPADALKFSRFGVVYPERLVSSLQQLGPVTAEGREMLAGLMKDCVVPEMLDSSFKASQIVNSTDIWATIRSAGWLNAARYTMDLNGAPISCPAHADAVDGYYTATEIPAMQKYLGMRMVPDHINPSAAIATSVPQVEAQLFGMARTMQQSLMQSAMIDMVPKGVALAGASGQPLQVAMNLASSQANMASDINYKSMAAVAKDALPKVRNTVEFIIIASFPLMLIMVIAAGHYAGSMLRTYFVMLLWVQLWAPLYAVLNYLVISTDTNPLNQLITAYGGNTIASAGLIQEFGSSSSAIAGGLTVLVPIIAYYLASRAEIAATSMVSSLMQPAQQAGGAMAAQASQGNVNMGKVSWGDVSTNNWSSNSADSSVRSTNPGMLAFKTAGGTQTLDGAGNLTGYSATPVSARFTSSISGGTSSTSTDKSSDGVNASSGSGATLSTNASATFGSSLGADEKRGLVDAFQSQFGGAFRTQSSTSGRGSSSATEGLDLQQTLSVLDQISMGGGVRGGGSNGGDNSVSVTEPSAGGRPGAASVVSPSSQSPVRRQTAFTRGSVDGNYGMSATTFQNVQDIATGKYAIATQQQRETAAQIVRDTIDSAIGSASTEGGRNALRSLRSSFEKDVALATTRSASVTNSESAGNEKALSRTAGQSTSVDPTLAMLRELEKQPGGLLALEENLANPATFPAAAAAVLSAAQAISKDPQVAPLVTGGIVPKSREEVGARGDKEIADLKKKGAGAVAAARTQGDAAVAERWEALGTGAPGDPVDMGLAAQRFNSTSEDVQKNLSQRERWASEGGGAVIAAKAMTDDQKGFSYVASIAFLGGVGYQSPAELAPRILQTSAELAQRGDTALADTLNDIGRSKHATPQQLEFIAIKLPQATRPTPPTSESP